ncbi:MAG: site-specific integrase [Rikenellaceae bacterium]|nr:site-specific integrase [Rikenellaceae bacterium]
MFKYEKRGITITCVLDIRHQRKNGEYPIKIRVTFRSKSWYYPVKQSISKELWNKIVQSDNSIHPEIREDIENCYLLVKSHVNSLVEKKAFSLDQLKSDIKRIDKASLNSLFRDKIANLQLESQIGTMIMYESTLHIIERRFPKEIAIEQVDLKWLKEFEKYLRKNRSQATVYSHMRNIRAVLNMAISLGYMSRNLYAFGQDGYKVKCVHGRKKALTCDEIKRIINFKSKSKELRKYRDLWVFMYLCNGITVDDLIMLKYRNLYDDEIRFVRGKTKRMTSEIKEIQVPLLKELKTIIKRWGNKPLPNNYIFPLIKHTVSSEKLLMRKGSFTKNFNQQLKIIGALLNIDNLTTVTARHSFATVLKRNGVNVPYISESLGHKDVATTERYLAHFEKDTRIENSNLLLSFIKPVDME